MSTELILQLATLVGGMAATYAAIRADLARLSEKTNQAVRGAERAHVRIDDHIDQHHTITMRKEL